MIISIIYLIISLALEVIMSNFFSSTLNNTSILSTIYTLIALVVIYPHFNNDKKFFILVIIFGTVFNIIYIGNFIFTIILFLTISISIKVLYNIFPENIFMTNLISIIIITIYHILSFIILSIMSSINYDFILLINIILSSIIMTIVYTTISYYIIKILCNKFSIKQIK